MGLAIAYTAAQLGKKVALFEKNARPQGATVRNFGLIWPIEQPGASFDRAMRSRETWLHLAEEIGFWAKPQGSLHLAYSEDELSVLEEFVATTGHIGYQCKMLTPLETISKSPAVNPIRLEGALWSATEVNIDPREAIECLYQYLRTTSGVDIFYNTAITQIDHPVLSNGASEWQAERTFVCSGDDFETLYSEIFADSGLIKCKMQMMRTVPQPKNWTLGANLAAGLTLQQYASFAHCESLALLKKRFAREMSDYNRWGIHVLVSQTRLGELTIGDSHEYGNTPDLSDRKSVNELILKYLQKFLKVPSLQIAEMWNGVHAKLPGKPEFIAEPEPGVMVVSGLGGAGMTLAFGLAQELLEQRVPRHLRAEL